ncbi:MAG: LD-carboxypeptidase [Lachnospiraceae bacterium]|nr:LD-carboxypeptidase [Lachnospiraceae bacterium]
MKYPAFLNPGGTIGFPAPSFGCVIEPYRTGFDTACAEFERMGYRTLKGPNCYEDCGVGISNTPEACGSELTEMYCAGDSDILISCGGGELMCEILDHVDFDAVKKATPKWFMGYSDNTNFTFTLATMCDTASVYGSNAPSFGPKPWHVSNTDAFDLLTGKALSFTGYPMWEKESLKTEENPLAQLNLTEKTVVKPYPGVTVDMKGRLLGGCLDCLINLCGTKYDHVAEWNKKYAGDGTLWFLESCDLNVIQIRRALWQLKHAGWFDSASGFLIGRPLHFDEDFMGIDRFSAVLSMLEDLHVPILFDADIGHLPPRMPVVCGSLGHVWTHDGTYSVEFTFA